MKNQDVFYREPKGFISGFNYWTYSDGRKVALNAAWALKQIRNKSARLVEVT